MAIIKAPKKLIEVALPLDDINIASSKEKSIRHGHPSTLHLWFARRPLAAARAILFAQMVNDPGYERHLGRGVNKEKAKIERERLFAHRLRRSCALRAGVSEKTPGALVRTELRGLPRAAITALAPLPPRDRGRSRSIPASPPRTVAAWMCERGALSRGSSVLPVVVTVGARRRWRPLVALLRAAGRGGLAMARRILW